uniref:Uncharacterized protein n=1 Tax=Setaria viridis TaxID=4556 RepID=A0A4U6UW33_SETVI|nr:hypothetical protein SEVIR_4G057603v2 [Setaria viridis]
MRRLRLEGHCLQQKAHGARNPGRRRLGWLAAGLVLSSLLSSCVRGAKEKTEKQEMPGGGNGRKRER